MAFDIVCSCGVNIKKNNLNERLGDLYNILNTKYSNKKSDKHNVLPISIFMKKFYELKHIDESIKTMNKYYNSDGLIFTPVDLGIMENTHYTLLKWKKYDTIDFEISENDGKKYLNLVNEHKLQRIQETSTEFTGSGGCIVECLYLDNKWIPQKERVDKDKANTVKTLERTMVTIKDDVNINYIKTLLKEHKIL